MANSRRIGHDFERDVVRRLKDRGWDVYSSRYASKLLDDAGIDIAGDYPRKVQCKSLITTPKIQELLETTEADTIFWRKREKRKTQFYTVGEYAIVELEEFLNLIDKAYGKERRVEVQPKQD